MKFHMKLLKEPFDNIKNGTKTIEFRLYDEKRKQIKVGDIIEFSLLPDLNEKIETKVIELYRANTFEELFRKFYTDENETENKLESIHSIYTLEKEKKYGVLGIKLELI